MAPIIDFHCHVFPDPTQGKLSPLVDPYLAKLKPLTQLLSRKIHDLIPNIRHLPSPLAQIIDELGVPSVLPLFLIDHSAAHLLKEMAEVGVTQAVIIAHPPLASNEFILKLASEHPELIAAVNITPAVEGKSDVLKKYHEEGAKILKIHPAFDGKGPDYEGYHELLATASELKMPVILHTGCIHSHLMYKNPSFGDVTLFESWFSQYREIKFVLAHMNYHSPNVALDIAERNENCLVDTSWQPSEIIAEAVRRIGPSRVLFGTDWPIVGNNFNVGISRIHECVTAKTISDQDSEQILGLNALNLLELREAGAKSEVGAE